MLLNGVEDPVQRWSTLAVGFIPPASLFDNT
jgi:hypothetical protein